MTYSGQKPEELHAWHIYQWAYTYFTGMYTYIHTYRNICTGEMSGNVVNHLHFSKVPNSRRAHFLIKKLILFKFKWLAAITIKYWYHPETHACLAKWPPESASFHLCLLQKPWRATAGVSSVSASPGWPEAGMRSETGPCLFQDRES